MRSSLTPRDRTIRQLASVPDRISVHRQQQHLYRRLQPEQCSNSEVPGESNIIRIGDGATQTDTYLTGIIHGNGSGLTLAGTTSLSGDLNLPATTSASTGVLQIGGTAFLHAYGASGLGSGNLFVGSGAGNFSQTGTNNTGNGYQALAADTSGSNDTASGYNALNSNTSGNNNTATGYAALGQNSTGGSNIALGYLAGFNLTTGSNNIDIGSLGTPGESNIIRIGSSQTDTYSHRHHSRERASHHRKRRYQCGRAGVGPRCRRQRLVPRRLGVYCRARLKCPDFTIWQGIGNIIASLWVGCRRANRFNRCSKDGTGNVGIGTSTPNCHWT